MRREAPARLNESFHAADGATAGKSVANVFTKLTMRKATAPGRFFTPIDALRVRCYKACAL
jgi:hypothetical protein